MISWMWFNDDDWFEYFIFLIAIGILSLIIIFAFNKIDKRVYEYTDFSDNVGYSKRCNSSSMICVDDKDGSYIRVKRLKEVKVGE